MPRYLSIALLLCAAPVHAVVLDGKYIPQANLSNCDPYALTDQTDNAPWPKRASPRHCSTIGLDNPVFVWTRPTEAGASTYAQFHLEGSDGSRYDVTTSGTRLIYPGKLTPFDPSKPSGPGNPIYQWTVSYPVGGVMKISSPRKFVVAGNFHLPTGADIVAAATAHSHPRAVPVNASYDDIRDMTGARSVELQAAFAVTRADADKFKLKDSSGNVVESHAIFVPTAAHTKTELAHGAIRERRAIELLGHMYFLTGDKGYLNACKERLLSLAKWADAGEGAWTSQQNQDQANREAFLGLAIGLDIFKTPNLDVTLSPDEVTGIVARIRSRIHDSREQFDGLDKQPFDSHVVSATHYANEALMYLVGMPEVRSGFVEADNWLAESWTTLATAIGVWGGTSDGGFGNGTSYGWYSTNKNARSLAAIKLITDIDLTRFAPMGKIGMNLIAQTPPASGTSYHHQMGMFGDGTEVIKQFRDYAGDDFRLLAYATELPEYEWYWRTHTALVEKGKSLLPYNFLLNVAKKSIPARPALPDSFLFEDAGYAVFHYAPDAAKPDTANPNRTSVFFRSSPQGTASHAEADNNAVTLVWKGYDALVSSGFYKAWEDPHFNAWTRHTRSKNALTVSARTGSVVQSGIGQAQEVKDGQILNSIYSSAEASGKLVNFHNSGKWRVVTGDATKAYRTYSSTSGWQPLLSKAIRTVAFNREAGVVLIYDYATSPVPRAWELNYHTLTMPVLDENRLRIPVGPWVKAPDPADQNNLYSEWSRIEPKSEICLQYYGPASDSMVFSQSNIEVSTPAPASPTGYNYVVDQFHTRWTTKAETVEYRALTVIQDKCTDLPPELKDGSTLVKANVGGSVIAFDKGTVTFD